MNPSNPTRSLKRRNLFRAFFGIFSLSGIMFVFQACYGTPQDFGQDILVQGKVTSALTKKPVPGIKVLINESGQYTESAADGSFSIYSERFQEYKLIFTDTDGVQNGQYLACDTVLQLSEEAKSLIVNVELR